MSPQPKTTLARLGSWSFVHRRRVVGAWLLTLVAAIAILMPLAGDYNAEFTTPNSDSEAADAVLTERFTDRSSSSLDVVWHSAEGAQSPAVKERIDGLLVEASQLEGLKGATPAEVSRDGETAVARLQIDGDEAPAESAEALIELAEGAAGSGLQIELAGFEIQEAQASETSPEMVGFIMAAIILLLTFGSVVAAGLPILTALFGLGVATALIGLVAGVMDVPDFAPAVAGMIGIGVGIDYALLVVTRYRTGLADGKEPRQAVAEATATAGRSVVIAGLTVVIAMLGLMAMGLSFLNGVAIAASLAVLVAVVAAITLLPATLGVIGPRIDRLHIPGSKARVAAGDGGSRWLAWSRGIQRRPWAALAAGVALIAAMALPVTDFRLGFPDSGNDREETTTRQAYELVSEGFGPGANGPLLLTAELPDGGGQAALADLRQGVADTPGVASVSPPRPNEAGDAAVLMAIPETSPQDEATEALVTRLRDDVIPPVEQAGGAEVHVGGITAALVDQSDYTLGRLPLMIAVVVGLSFLLLLASFRSVPVAVKAAFMNLLSIGAAYGVVALLSQGGFAGELVGIDTATPVPPFVPVMMFAILFGLSMDYEVFLLSRIREEYLASGDNPRAVVDGLAKTGRVITAAALIMVAVFSSFALSDDVILKLMGIGMATAILVDATIVRMLLVPAVMQILGRANWWMPNWLDRLLPRVNGHSPATPAPAAPAAASAD
ncbi:MAG: MMPL family transporter [Thermoleophilaceae bacterium]